MRSQARHSRIESEEFEMSSHRIDHIADAEARLPPNATWIGLVPEPSDPRAVPVILCNEFGMVDSLTWARHLVSACQTLAAYESSANPDSFDPQWLQSANDDWYNLRQPLNAAAVPAQLAVAAVALQRLAVEVGREWVENGFDLLQMPTPRDKSAAEPQALRELWEWVMQRWTQPAHDNECDLRPDRAMSHRLQGEVGVSVVMALAARIADLLNTQLVVSSHVSKAMHSQSAGMTHDAACCQDRCRPGASGTCHSDSDDLGPPF